jgi:hypothetical protein
MKISTLSSLAISMNYDSHNQRKSRNKGPKCKVFTDLDAILKDASIVSCPFNKFNPLTLKLITLTALHSIFASVNEET